MMGRKRSVARREFLKLAGLFMASLVFPSASAQAESSSDADCSSLLNAPSSAGRSVIWPALSLDKLPSPIREILARLPKVFLDEQGLLRLEPSKDDSLSDTVPLVQTQWNLEHSQPLDRLLTDIPWALVFHWYGEPEGFDKTLTGYLRGFDSLRKVGDYLTRTSAHFLVGDAPAATQAEAPPDQIGIIQTQMPDKDGVPFVASHLRPLDYELHRERQQYYVKALDALEYANPQIHSLLQDFYDGPKIDPGWRTIAVEVTGKDFDGPSSYPSAQKIANVLALTCAVMKRYAISALDVLGHQEIEMQKSDPGRGFMAYLRFLLGVKALADDDHQLKELVFGRLLGEGKDACQAVWDYFQFVRNYLVLVSLPDEVSRWEAFSRYWLMCDLLPGRKRTFPLAVTFGWPLAGEIHTFGGNFLNPENHEGVDLFVGNPSRSSDDALVRLVADGECLYAGISRGYCPGKLAIFRHLLEDGRLILTVYGHLSELAPHKIGQVYPKGHVLGKLSSPYPFMERYLHFAVAYGATWETDLCHRPDVPLDAKPAWIRGRYFPPLDFLSRQVMAEEKQRKMRN